jgi:hypothetical protein
VQKEGREKRSDDCRNPGEYQKKKKKQDKSETAVKRDV